MFFDRLIVVFTGGMVWLGFRCDGLYGIFVMVPQRFFSTIGIF